MYNMLLTCPWPNEILRKLSALPILSANCNKLTIGSTPGERINISGLTLTESP